MSETREVNSLVRKKQARVQASLAIQQAGLSSPAEALLVHMEISIASSSVNGV